MNTGGNGLGGVERDIVRDAGREAASELLHARGHSLSCGYRIRAWELVDGHDTGRRLIVTPRDGIELIPKLDPRDIAEVKNGAVRVRANGYFRKLFRSDQAALGAHRIGELLALGNRLATNLARGIHIVLGLDGSDDIGRRDAKLRHLVRIHPHAQRVLTTEGLHARDAFYAGDLILKIDDGVIGEEILTQFPADRVNGN